MIEAVNTRDFDALDDLVSPTVRRYSGATPEVQVTSLDDFKAFLHADLAAVPDAMQEVNMIFSSGDMVAVHETYSGTQTGQMGPFPPSGRSTRTALHRFAENRGWQGRRDLGRVGQPERVSPAGTLPTAG